MSSQPSQAASKGPSSKASHSPQDNTPVFPRHVFYEDKYCRAGLTRRPTTRGQVVIRFPHDLMASSIEQFVHIMRAARKIAGALCAELLVSRCALISDGTGTISIIPLHRVGPHWQPIIHEAKEYNDTYPGYVTSKNGPHMEDQALEKYRDAVTECTQLREPYDRTFHGTEHYDNLFAKIVRSEVPNWRLWENSDHVAFLTPFPNSPGFTVLVPRKYLDSDLFSLDKVPYVDLALAGQRMGRILMDAFKVKRCGMIFEGLEIDYAHIKLIPVLGKDDPESASASAAPTSEFHETYPGFVTSQYGMLTEDVSALDGLASALRERMSQATGDESSDSEEG